MFWKSQSFVFYVTKEASVKIYGDGASMLFQLKRLNTILYLAVHFILLLQNFCYMLYSFIIIFVKQVYYYGIMGVPPKNIQI